MSHLICQQCHEECRDKFAGVCVSCLAKRAEAAEKQLTECENENDAYALKIKELSAVVERLKASNDALKAAHFGDSCMHAPEIYKAALEAAAKNAEAFPIQCHCGSRFLCDRIAAAIRAMKREG